MMYIASNFSSVADYMTCFIMWAMLRTAPLFYGMVESLDRVKCPPAPLRAFGLLRYLVSLCASNFMSVVLNVSTVTPDT